MPRSDCEHCEVICERPWRATLHPDDFDHGAKNRGQENPGEGAALRNGHGSHAHLAHGSGQDIVHAQSAHETKPARNDLNGSAQHGAAHPNELPTDLIETLMDIDAHGRSPQAH
eukprot:14061033-Alexandrium_andersonii.AAC.1